MAENSKIEWTDHTFNPWIGCMKVSPGCDHCYAERREDQRLHRVKWGPGQQRQRTKTWGEPVKWNKRHAEFFAAHGRRQRVFCASLADVFDNEAPRAWRLDLFELIEATPHLDWLLLTKRVGNVRDMLKYDGDREALPANVWLGITVVNQAEANRDIPKLLAVPARVRFLSVEPMLGPIRLDLLCAPADRVMLNGLTGKGGTGAVSDFDFDRGIDWVISGGESGANARPMHPDWARSLRNQCQTAGVPFFFKQWGEWTPGENVKRVRGTVDTAFLHDDGWHVYPLNLATDHGHIDDQPDLYRVGRLAAGRLLDGVTHDGTPT